MILFFSSHMYMTQVTLNTGIGTNASGIIVPEDGYWNSNPWSEQVGLLVLGEVLCWDSYTGVPPPSVHNCVAPLVMMIWYRVHKTFECVVG